MSCWWRERRISKRLITGRLAKLAAGDAGGEEVGWTNATDLPPNVQTAVQLFLGHLKLERVPYLGIEVDDVLEIAEQTEI